MAKGKKAKKNVKPSASKGYRSRHVTIKGSEHRVTRPNNETVLTFDRNVTDEEVKAVLDGLNQ